MIMSDRLLLISYAYPPAKSVGSIRPSKWVKYISECGWSADIITSVNTSTNHEEVTSSPGNIHRVQGFFDGRFDSPHGGIRWVYRMVKKTRDLSHEYNYDCVLVTGPPFVPFCSLPLVSRIVDAPYVLDFRDPWSPKLTPYSPPANSILSKVYSVCSNSIEGKLIERAAMNITPVPELTERYATAYPSSDFETIYNGFDPDDYDVEPECTSCSTRLVYPGKYYREMDIVFEYLQSNSSVKLTYFGNDDRIHEVASKYNVQNQIDFRGYQPITEVAKSIKSSTCGIAVTRDEAAIPQKCFDYMACRTPIVAIDPYSGALSRLVAEADAGISITEPRVEHISEAITLATSGDIYQSDVDRFSRRQQTKQLIDILENCI